MTQDISDFEWKNRVLILVAKDLNNEGLKTQLEAFKGFSDDFEARDLILFISTPQGTYTSQKTSVDLKGIDTFQKNNFKGIILLGKDGGIKLKEPFTVTAKTILNVIDAMPMRQREKKSQQ
ncbi:DUF4174 domain-containing protein [Cellulophaga sp. Hel_I_12]|uniref:DUF4174 domain-containing protein n=1 Tax=Cellulophaga sp. Hel_I_12 TaxID=1249972 RepID=UPI000A88F1D5|nr:DUF4174 domain-containing protein [Cellulophaga sp. Hel_I_12]